MAVSQKHGIIGLVVSGCAVVAMYWGFWPTGDPFATGVQTHTSGESGLIADRAILKTSKGIITIQFFGRDAPVSVRRVTQLIQAGFYDGLAFCRVVPDFLIQTGDPHCDGTGGSGIKLKAEFNRNKHLDGTVALARGKDPDSADSQIYITLGTYPHLDGNYTVIGKVVEGLDVAHRITQGERVESVRIEQ